jgi:hypothetical protein
MNAPLPHFISRTSASKPAASFFESIDAVIRSTDSTVAVTSRIAYNRLSAGAISSVCPTIAQPTVLTVFLKSSMLGCDSYPGIESNLSKVPPVCPSPLPETIGTNPPHAAREGASNKETQSPTPPVECLSIIGPAKSH